MIVWDCLGKCCHPIPQRFIVATMVMTGIAVTYVNRLAFNLALTEIVFTHEVKEELLEHVCQYNQTDAHVKIANEKAEFHWSINDQANILGAFYFGYLFTHLPGGILADLYGPKRVMGAVVLLSMLVTFLTPLIARANLYLLIASRVVLGLAQGPVFPALSVFVARWSLPHERNIINAYTSSGVVFGGILSNALTGFLLYTLSIWDHVFYIYGFATLLWFILWYLFAHEDALSHPFITEKERQKINDALKEELNMGGPRMKLPYCKILKSIPVWVMVSANCGHDWAFYVIVTMLPQYMAHVLRFNVKDNGLINSLPYIGMITVSLSSAKLAEILVKKGCLTKTIQCKIWCLFATVIPCAIYVIASYVGCQRVIVVILFVVAMGFQGTTYSSLRVVNVDMSPNFAGTLMSLLNGVGSLCGLFTPIIFALFTTDQTVTNWRYAFWFSLGLVSLMTSVFLIWGTSKVQPWNFPPGGQPAEGEAGPEQGKANEDKTS